VPEPILILTGPPGAGKTTTARLLTTGPERAAHLESDSFFHFIRAGYVEPWKPESDEQNTTVMRIVAAAAAGYAGGGLLHDHRRDHQPALVL
jgi:tRNA uridine 5-carbamoylmethylation protein Kti12